MILTSRCSTGTNVSSTYYLNTNEMTSSPTHNGSQSQELTTTPTASYSPDVIALEDLNGIELLQSTLTLTKLWEHWALHKALRSMDLNAVYRGFEHSKAYRNIKHIIKDLIELEVLSEDCYLGRMPFCGIDSFTRAAINTPVKRLLQQRVDIDIYAMTHGYEPDELFNVLVFTSINAGSNGHYEFESQVMDNGLSMLRNGITKSVRKGVLMGRYSSVKLFTATYANIGGN
jgi:hypothetical protein